MSLLIVCNLHLATGSGGPKAPEDLGVCEGKENCVTVDSWLKKVGGTFRDELQIPLIRATIVSEIVDDPIVQFERAGNINKKVNDLKAALLPIQDLEALKGIFEVPVNDRFGEVINRAKLAIEPFLEVKDLIYPQPLTSEEQRTLDTRADAEVQCTLNGFPIPNPNALYEPLFFPGIDAEPSDPLPCKDLDDDFPERVPARLTSDDVIVQADYDQRLKYNERWGVEDDPFVDPPLPEKDIEDNVDAEESGQRQTVESRVIPRLNIGGDFLGRLPIVGRVF